MLQKFRSELKFIIVGGSSTLIDFIIYMLISTKLDISISKVISMSIASIYSFFINKNWTFNNKDSINVKMILKYIFSQLINIGVNTITNTIIYNLTKLKIIAFIIATGVAMCVNYILQKLIVFKKGEKAV